MSDFGYTIGVETADGVANLQKLEAAQEQAKVEAKKMGQEMEKTFRNVTSAQAKAVLAAKQASAKGGAFGGGQGKGGMAAVAAANTLQDAQYGFMGVQNNLIQMASMAGRFAGPLAIAVTGLGVAYKLAAPKVEELTDAMEKSAKAEETATAAARREKTIKEQMVAVNAQLVQQEGELARRIQDRADAAGKIRANTYSAEGREPFREAARMAAGSDPQKQADAQIKFLKQDAAGRQAAANANLRQMEALAESARAELDRAEKAAADSKANADKLEALARDYARNEAGIPVEDKALKEQAQMQTRQAEMQAATARATEESQKRQADQARKAMAETRQAEDEARRKAQEEGNYQRGTGMDGRSAMEQEILNIQTRATQEKEKQAAQERRMLQDAERRGRQIGEAIMKDAKASQEKQAAFLKDYEAQTAINKARADGKNKEAREMERQRDLEEEIARIQLQGGATRAEAEKLARTNMAARLKAETEGMTAGGRVNTNAGLAAREAAAARKQAREARRALRDMEEAAKRGTAPAAAAQDPQAKTEGLLQGIMNVLKEKLTTV